MGRGKLFQCEITVSSGVKEKLTRKHDSESGTSRRLWKDSGYRIKPGMTAKVECLNDGQDKEIIGNPWFER